MKRWEKCFRVAVTAPQFGTANRSLSQILPPLHITFICVQICKETYLFRPEYCGRVENLEQDESSVDLCRPCP